MKGTVLPSIVVVAATSAGRAPSGSSSALRAPSAVK